MFTISDLQYDLVLETLFSQNITKLNALKINSLILTFSVVRSV